MARVLVCDRVSAPGVELLRQVAEVVEAGALGEDELIAALAGCDALVVRSATKVTARVFAEAPGLRVVARAGAGVDNIDVEAATRHGVLVVNSPAGNTLAAAEHTIAMLLAAARNIPQAYASMKAKQFDRKRFMGRQVTGKTLGVVGLGKIGGEVARRARSLGMEVLAYDPYARPEQLQRIGARQASLEEVLRGGDFITVHTPLTEETRGLIGAEALALMKPEAILINCARGGIVDEAALLDALREGRIAGAALDVFEGEPHVNWELVAHEAVIATPHLGASTSEAQEAVALDAAQQIVDVLQGRPPSSPVNVPALDPEVMAELAPFLTLAERLGRLGHVLTPAAPSHIQVSASSAAPAQGLPLVASKLLCGIFKGKVDESLNEVNAMLIARELGVEVACAHEVADHGYLRHMQVTIRLADQTCTLAGAVLEGSQPRILGINGYSLDLAPEGEVVLVWKRQPQVPGFIGVFGSAMAEAGVGILSIEVGRETIADTGLLVARVDRRIGREVLEGLRQRDDVARVELVSFSE